MNDTLTIELTKPLVWRTVERDSDLDGVGDLVTYVLRKDGQTTLALLNKMGRDGLDQFHIPGREYANRFGWSGYPFEVARIFPALPEVFLSEVDKVKQNDSLRRRVAELEGQLKAVREALKGGAE